MRHPTYRIAHTTAFVTPVVEHWLEREIAQWVHHMKDRSEDPSHHERTLLPRSYISLLYDTIKQDVDKVGPTIIFKREKSHSYGLFCTQPRGKFIELYISFESVIHDWCNKYIHRGICYPVCGMVHVK